MGGYGFRVGDYELIFMDYHYDEFPKDEDEEQVTEFEDPTFFDKLLISCTIEKVGTDKKKRMDTPMSSLYTIKQDEKSGKWFACYDDDADGPREWLFKTLRKQGKKIETTPCLSLHIGDGVDYLTLPDYYLNSDIGDDDIKISTARRTFEIADLGEIDWLAARGFIYG